jgi:hypothetical protein
MENELIALRERIAELQEQNTHLREAALTFAQLAERLNQSLRDERNRRSRRKSREAVAPEPVAASA